MFNKVIGVTLGVGAIAFVLLLAGVGSGVLTDDPPAVSPYASDASGSATLFIAAVEFGDAGYIEIANVGDGVASLDGYWLCQFPAYHPISGSIAAGETVRLNAASASFGELDAESGEVGLYTSDSFDDPTAIVAYVEWGSPGHTRSSTAVAAEVWTEGSVVDAARASRLVAVEDVPINADGWVAES